MESEISNKGKQENYRIQFQRLKKAMENAFFLEAVFIEYAIFEDRAEAVLSYEGNSIIPKNEKEFITFARKKNRIVKLSEKKDSIIRRYFSDDLMEQIMNWINERNSVIHALLKKRISTGELKEFAARGEFLCKEFRNRVRSYKRTVARKKKQIIA